MNYPNFLVRINCLTYNHAPYIEDAMNGFCMQETTFPFVATIIDDASTDGEQEVIKKYLDDKFDLSENSVSRKWETDDAHFIYAQHKENKNCYFAVVLLKYNFWQLGKDKQPLVKEWRDIAEYIAFCEGDDYWIDREKLEKQINFLEQHPDYSMCFHKAKIQDIRKKNNLIVNFSDIKDGDYTSNDVLSRWLVPTASIVGRTAIQKRMRIKGKYRPWATDICCILNFGEYGILRGFEKEMSVYRVHDGGQSNRNISAETWVEHYKCLRYNFHSLDKKVIDAKISMSLYWVYKGNSSFFKRIKALFEAVYINPRYVIMHILKNYYVRYIVGQQ
jgi:glycosyltransferase involved in cell wall biosynthesis